MALFGVAMIKEMIFIFLMLNFLVFGIYSEIRKGERYVALKPATTFERVPASQEVAKK